MSIRLSKASMKNEKLAVETLLPPRFLFQIGAYLQTCAHIELAICAVITCLEGCFPPDDNWLNKYSKNRKTSTSELIKKLRRTNKAKNNHGFAKDLEKLVDWIDRFVDNRHLAAHGAFFGSPEGFLRVDYLRNTGKKKSPNYEQTRTAITEAMVTEVLNDANDIYLVLLGMLEQIKPGLSTDVHRVIVPLVEHPVSAK